MNGKKKLSHRLVSIVLCLTMLLTYLPLSIIAAEDPISTVADPQTLTRPETIYGDSTVNAGKITVGKSVSDGDITVNGQKITLDGKNNFLITISQSAQVMGLTSESSVPVDVVFVLDTSGSMKDNDRAETMVSAANSAIKTLLAANDQNRVGVVAFSSEEYGGGTSNDAAANVLSSLAHYNDAAAENHLQWVDSSGEVSNSGGYIAGRDSVTITTGRFNPQTRTVNAYRHGKNGGTNIQAGIIAGAQMLTSATNTTYTDPTTGKTVNRIPFLIILSDGQPTYTYDDDTWYNPTLTGNNAAGQQGPGSGAYEGNGFIAALTAAYYKGKISEHYYGENAGSGNHCYVYTMGVELDSLTGDNKNLAQITLDPKTYTAGDYADTNANSYWNYGNTANDYNKDDSYGWKTAWESYVAGRSFDIRIESPDRFGEGGWYTFTADSIANSKQYVSSIAYNDEYYNASSVGEMEKVFTEMVTTIQKKSISVPTKVTTGDHNFDGYITFTDPLGAYMEVKDMKGVLAGGHFYQGSFFAEKISKYGTADADPEFDQLILNVLKSRMHLTESSMKAEDFIAKAKASSNQAYYNGADDYDNSFVWWGNAYNSGEEDEQVQVLDIADNDTIEYIESAKAAGTIPAGADYVCRSYFFHGDANSDDPEAYLYFMVRVQRELTAPYRETVVISAPASLLSMEKVLITETFDENGNPTYSATVEHQEPARVVYEVGLWDTITPENVTYIVSADYANTGVNGGGSVNYDPATKKYNFFTNDWDRNQSLDSHHRALAKATFDAAPDNAFYTYQEDTLLVDANGNPVTSDPAGHTAYYVREYYQWTSDSGRDGTYSATKTSTLVEVDIPAGTKLLEKDGKWYVLKGTYTAATLVVNGDDTMKEENKTGTSSIVAHPHRTGGADNSHYTVFLGNNGRLTLKAEPYKPTKTVSMERDGDPIITDYDGNPVRVGDILTYTVNVKNVLTETADITVSDYVPFGTAFVEGSAGTGVVSHEKNSITWVLNDVPAGETRSVSFKVRVTEAALNPQTVASTIDNTATVKIGNTPAVTTNTTKNPLYGKSVTDGNNQIIDGKDGFKVGDYLTYHIRVTNTESVAADVTVTDKIPAGTVYVENSADNADLLHYDSNTGTLIWTIPDMAPGAVKLLSFQVQITADAKAAENATQPAEGDIEINNTADIRINNKPVITTNPTVNKVGTGDMTISKIVEDGGDQTKSFEIKLTESTGRLSGTYVLNGSASANTVTFADGKASVSIKHGETLTVKGLPVGAIIGVEESSYNGWTPAQNTKSVTIVEGTTVNVASVSITNTYRLTPLVLTLKGQKVLNNTLPAPVTFGFVAVPDANNPGGGAPLTGEVAVTTAGTYGFSFSPKVFTAPGVYTYTISEINGGVKGVTYDTNVHTLVITIADKGDGTLSATATLDGNAFDMANGAVTFSNTYTPEDVPLTVTGKKTLMVYDSVTETYKVATPEAGKFRFQIKDAAGNIVSTGTNDANGNIVFNVFYLTPALLGDAYSKDLTYTVSEIIPDLAKDPNMLYDTAGKTFTVTLSLNNGKLTATVNGDSDGAVDLTGSVNFTNYSNPASVTVVPKGEKTTTNAPSADITFSFSVINTANDNEASAGVGKANGTITFSPLTYTAPGVYTYQIKETNAGNETNGITYDKTVYLMKVTVTRNEKNRLVAAVEYFKENETNPVNAPTFNNQYSAKGYLNLTAKKILNGRDLNAGEFAFKLVRADTGNGVDGIVSADGTITFATLYYSEKDLSSGGSKVIKYVMSEVIPTTAKLPGVEYDTHSYDVYVRISDAGNGTINAELVTPDGNGGYTSAGTNGSIDTNITFTNNYAPVHGDTVKFQVKKTLNGRPLRAGEFEFLLIHNDVVVASATNDANGIVTFTHEYSPSTVPGIYQYTVREAKGYLHGITYDETFYSIDVEIKDDGRGHLTATLLASSGNPYPETNGIVDLTGSMEFKNTYTPDDVMIQLEATKELDGRNLRDKEFSFVVKDTAGNIVATGSNDENGKILFSAFDISAEDMAGSNEKTFTYYITESDNNVPGVTVDDNSYEVTVIVKNVNGVLSAEVQYPDSEPIVFENVYKPTNQVKVPLVAYKTLIGKKLNEGEFTFDLKDEAGNTLQAKNDGNGVIPFELTFTERDMKKDDGSRVHSKTFQYTLSEVKGSAEGMTYDETVYTITVTVTDDQNGKLTATVSYPNNDPVLRFTNDYTPPKLTVEIGGLKSIVDAQGNALTDRNQYPLSGFEFELCAPDGSPLKTATSDVDGKISFPGLSFTAAGEYRYLIKEKATAKAGYSTDATVWCVHITVDYDAATGTLSENQAKRIVHLAPENHDGIMALVNETVEFVNVYDPADVDLMLKGKKVLEGRELREHEFTFYMMDSAGLLVSETRNHANGDVNFHLTYDKAGTYQYTVYESKNSSIGGIAYSTAVYEVTVTVTDDGTGELKAKVESISLQGGESTDSLVFTNVYTPDPVDVTVTAQKHLEGKELKAGAYTFKLISKNDSQKSYTAVNKADGTVEFDPITFSKVGEYVYTLTEVSGTESGVTYDKNAYTVTITVTDDGNGQLHAVTHYTSGAGDTEAEPGFHNVYKANSVDYVLTAKKIFEGGTMRPFHFVLSGEGFDTQTKQNNDKGEITFDKLTFTKIGKYTFTLKELAEAEAKDILFDPNVYTVVIEVTDNFEGQLKIQSVLVTSDNGRTDLVFRNVHESEIAKKDVFLNTDPTVSIDGKSVNRGDTLTYTITYKNYTGKAATVTITDTIPAHTTYVENSADNGGVYADGKLTWNLTLNPEENKTVSFCVSVADAEVSVSNQAIVLEGENRWETNLITTPVNPDNPKTDDNNHLALWFALMVVSGGFVVATAFTRRKKAFDEN